MHDFEFLRARVEDGLNSISIPQNPADLYDPIRYTLEMGGKRIRPVVCLMACEMFGSDYAHAMPAALSIEVFHNFTLLHDDIMDQSPVRRGKPTVYRRWNTNVAILSGDTMFALAYSLLRNLDSRILSDVLAVFSRTAIEVCEGQQYDMDFESLENVAIDEYLNMIRLKTAVLLAGSLQIGAICGNASPEDADSLYRFGENTGLAFQLMDDYLDTFGDEKVFGKRTGNDIIAGKKTYLILKAMEIEAGLGSDRLRQAMEIGQPVEKVQKVTEILNSLGVRENVKTLINQYHNMAIESLRKVKANTAVLEGMAEALLNREF